jgi:hypothetical protein
MTDSDITYTDSHYWPVIPPQRCGRCEKVFKSGDIISQRVLENVEGHLGGWTLEYIHLDWYGCRK